MIVINAENLVTGRLAAFAAKKAMEGEKVIIVNSEKAVVTGNTKDIYAHYQQKSNRGDALIGPFFPRTADRILRRAVCGMLPHKKPTGIEAYKRVMCYLGVPEKYKALKQETIEKADIKKSKAKYLSLGTISNYLKQTK